MELTFALVISIISVVVTVSNFVLGRKDKSNKDVENESYKNGQLDEKLKHIMEKLDKIENKLDSMENETKKIVNEEIEKHILKYHKGE